MLIVVSSLALAAIYALIGVGFVVMYRSTGVLSFAQGSYFLVGALLFYSVTSAGVGLVLGLVITLAIVGLAGAAMYAAVFQFARFDLLFVSLATVGVGIAIENAASLIWTPDLFRVRPLVPEDAHRIGGTTVTNDQLVQIALAVVLIGLLTVLLSKTRAGLMMRAVASDDSLAGYAGIKVRATSTAAWGIAAAVAAVAGAGYAMGRSIEPAGLPAIGLLVFPALIIGGLDSIQGAAVGAVVLAFVQTTTTVYLGSEYSSFVAYVLLLALLWFRPTGIFGSHQVSRL